MHRTTLRSTTLALAALLGVAGCGGTQLPVDGEMASVAVHGRVTRADGAPAAGVRVEVEARLPGSCSQRVSAADPVETGADGRYHAWVGLWGSRFDACLAARVLSGAAAELAADSTTVDGVQLRAVLPDSVRLDFVLAPR